MQKQSYPRHLGGWIVEGDVMKRQKNRIRQKQRVHTTIAEMTTAFFEAALAELGDEKLAERLATKLVADAMRTGRLHALPA